MGQVRLCRLDDARQFAPLCEFIEADNPGFKPHNEYYIDRDIRDTTGGTVAFNETLLETKNYQSIEELLD